VRGSRLTPPKSSFKVPARGNRVSATGELNKCESRRNRCEGSPYRLACC
jgi:hypothetical protein